MASLYHVRIDGPKAFVRNREGKDKSFREIDSLASNLGSTIEISPETTLGDLFNLLRKHAQIFSVVFADQLGNHSLDIYLDSAAKESHSEEERDIEYLEVSWASEVDIYKGTREGYLLPDFHGIGKDENGNRQFYGTSFIRLEDLAKYPLRLNKKTNVMVNDLDNTKCDIDNFDFGEVEFTVYDVLSGIFNEISFFGDPRSGKAAKILSEIDQARAAFDNGKIIFEEQE